MWGLRNLGVFCDWLKSDPPGGIACRYERVAVGPGRRGTMGARGNVKWWRVAKSRNRGWTSTFTSVNPLDILPAREAGGDRWKAEGPGAGRYRALARSIINSSDLPPRRTRNPPRTSSSSWHRRRWRVRRPQQTAAGTCDAFRPERLARTQQYQQNVNNSQRSLGPTRKQSPNAVPVCHRNKCKYSRAATRQPSSTAD